MAKISKTHHVTKKGVIKKNPPSEDPWKKFLKLDEDIQAETIWDFIGDFNYYELWDDYTIGEYSRYVDPNEIPYSTWVQDNDLKLKIDFLEDDEVLKKEFLESPNKYVK